MQKKSCSEWDGQRREEFASFTAIRCRHSTPQSAPLQLMQKHFTSCEIFCLLPIKHPRSLAFPAARVREDHLKSDLDQRSRSDKWSRSFYPKDHLKRKDQDLDQDHPKRSLSCTKDGDIQGLANPQMPGPEKMRIKSSAFPPATGMKTQLFILIFSEPGVSGLADPCT